VQISSGVRWAWRLILTLTWKSKMKNWRIIFVFVLASCATPNPYEAEKPYFEIVNYGLYSTQALHREDLTSSPTGKMTRSGDRNHIKTTTSIPSIIGTKFGVEYKVHLNNSGRIKLKIKWIPSTPIKGKSGKEYKEISYEKIKKTNYLQYAGYILSIESEIETESWTLQIISNDEILHEQIFFIN
jgi:hypothetical protein